jgi:hypothetical protein
LVEAQKVNQTKNAIIPTSKNVLLKKGKIIISIAKLTLRIKKLFQRCFERNQDIIFHRIAQTDEYSNK